MATGVNFGTQQYFGFDPRSVPNCVLWMDALDSNVISLSGSNVTGWTDKSSNGYVFSNATGYTYNVTKFNGSYPSFYAPSNVTGNFVGSNTSFSLAQPASFFIVCQLLDTAPGGYMFDSTNSGNRMAFIAYGGGKPVMFAGVELSNTVTTTFTSPGQHGGVFNGGSSLVFSNGTQTISGNAGTQGATGLIIGSRFSLNGAWGGHLCELLMFSRIVTTAERQQIEGYLGWKWGVNSNLPATHPYKSVIPYQRLFQPPDIDGITLWLDSADQGSNSMTLSGTTMTTWLDRSGNEFNFTGLTGTAGTIPVIGTLSNLPIVDTTGGGAFSNASCGIPGVTYSGFTTGYSTVPAASNAYSGLFYSTPDAIFMLRAYVAQMFLWKGNGGAWGSPSVATGPATTSNTIWSFTNPTAAGPSYLWVNGTLNQSNTGTTNIAASGLQIGRWVNSNNPWSGYIGDVIFYDSGLSDADRQRVEGYIGWKMGLRGNLPTTHPFYKFPPASIPFHPLVMSNCVLWLDGADQTSASMTFSGANITQWSDKSGNGRHAVLQATFTGATIGSSSVKSAPNFVGTSRYLVTYPTFPNSAYSIFTVQYATTNSGYMRVVHGSQTNRYLFVGTSNGNVAAFTGSGTAWNDIAGTSTTNFNTWRIVGAFVSGTAMVVYADGAIIASKSGATDAFSDLLIGNDHINTQQWNGNIAEILVFSGTVTAVQRRRIEGYLAWKWGLQSNLPTAHTYYKFRP